MGFLFVSIIVENLSFIRRKYKEPTIYVQSTLFDQILLTAIPKLDPPGSVSAVNEYGVLQITWVPPLSAVPIISYTVRVSHFPYNSYIDVPVTGNTTRYSMTPISHLGQNYSIRVMTETEHAQSDFSEEVVVMTGRM